jgi:hypothetical protein
MSRAPSNRPVRGFFTTPTAHKPCPTRAGDYRHASSAHDPARSEAKIRGRAIPSQRIPSPLGAAAHLSRRIPPRNGFISHPGRSRKPKRITTDSCSKGRPSRGNRAGDCGGTNASQARAKPRFRLYALRRAVPFEFRGFPGSAADADRTAKPDPHRLPVRPDDS